MIRLLHVAVTLMCAWFAGSCLNNQQHGATELSGNGNDCVMCHQANYDATVNPRHPGNMPTTCGDCHTTTAWRPASGQHPESSFAVTTGAHAGTACGDCHKPSLGVNAGGANTDCVACHPKPEIAPSHQGRAGYAWSDTRKNFCLDCHPSGKAEGGSHPEAQFPIAAGRHAGIACNGCHEPQNGPYAQGENTNCIRCHTAAETNSEHDEVGSYQYSTTDKNFCLRCHPDGRE